MNIITNNVPRDILYGYQLTDKEKKEFDYVETDELESHSFVKYKGWIYDLSNFMRWDNPASPTKEKWDGVMSESFFSGTVVRYTSDFEQVVMGRYCT